MIRIEKDFIGEREIADDALYGIHSVRASENFPDKTPFPEEWYRAVDDRKILSGYPKKTRIKGHPH